MNEFYTSDEVVKLFKISKASINRLVINGTLHPKEVFITPVIKNYLFDKNEIHSMLNGHNLDDLLIRQQFLEQLDIPQKRLDELLKNNIVTPVKFAFNKKVVYFTKNDLNKVLSIKDTFNNKQKWSYNKDYFKKIDSNEKAYWLGFITGDGYISDNRKKNNKSTAVSLRIRLNPRDTEILEKLNEALSYNKPLKIVKNYGIYNGCQDLVEFDLSNRELVNDLENLGLTSGEKSCKEIIPNVILNKDSFIKNFILGLFDADGYVMVNKNNFAEFGICSSYEMCEFIRNYLKTKFPDIIFAKIRNSHPNNPNSELYNFRVFGFKNISKLYEYFYLDKNCSKYFLNRKYEIFKNIYNHYTKS